MSSTPALTLLRAERHISASALNTFLTCPASYRFKYILQLKPTHRPGPLAFGSAIHTSLAHFYRELMNDQPELAADALVAMFSDAWSRELASSIPVLFDKDESADSVRDKGVALVRLFHAEAPRPHQVIGVEEPFSIEVCDPTTGEVFDERLVGAIDAITLGDTGMTCLLEHKTGAKKRSFEGDLQGAAYTHVAPRIGLGENVTVTYQLLTKTKTPALHIETVSFTAADERDFLRTVAGVLAAVRTGAFYPRRDWQCRGCPYAGPCLAG